MLGNFKIAILIIMALVILGLGLLVYFSNRKNKVNKIFGLFVISVALWSFGLAMFYSAPLGTTSLFWSNFLYLIASFIPAFFLYFSLIFPDRQSKFSRLLQLSIFIPNLVLFYLFFFTNFIILDAAIINGNKGFIYGSGHILWDLQFDAFFVWAFYYLIKKYRHSEGVIRAQLRYVVFGTLVGLILAGFTNVILPWFKVFKFLWLGPELTIVWVIAVAYAILRYRLMDIRIVFRKVFLYLMVAAFVYGFYYLVSWWHIKFSGGVFTRGSYLSGIIIAPIFVFVFYSVSNFLRKFVNKHFFAGLYNYQETISKLSVELNYETDLDKIIDSIVKTIKSTMQLDRTGVLLSDKDKNSASYRIAKIMGFNEKNGISLVQDNFLTKYLQRTQKPLVKDELSMISKSAFDLEERQGFQKLYDNMTRIEASLCLPLLSGNQLIGIIVLGSKISGDAYSKEDLDLLTTLANQAGIAVDNAILYKEVRSLNENLREKVDEQTGDIKKKALHLEKLLKMRSEFLDIASHQLRTPISVIIGILSMMKEGDFDDMPDEEKNKFIDSAFRKSIKLREIVEDILSASEMDTTEFSIPDTEIMPAQSVLDAVVADKRIEVEGKKLELIYHQPDEPLPNIKAHKHYISQALINLIDNAIQYTPDGSITIGAKREKGSVIFYVKDTGIGVPKEDLPKLFVKFGRAKNAREVYTDGTGLGLFIIKTIIEAHGGKVWVKSEENKGSCFFISLPIAR